MKLLRLYIENFMCHESSYIDFSEFKSALIVGKIGNNDLYSNGVGKTTIFKAIEYGLFNQADVNLDKIIRDDTSSCKITIDFESEAQEYRLIRTRTKKGVTDVSLFERTAVEDHGNDVVHIEHSLYKGIMTPVTTEKFWKDISGRRAADTEKDLNKILKINFKSFRSTVHFMQNDFSGLTTATPEKRKGILKEALNLAIYSKLEKIAKDKSNLISKDIERHKTLIESLQDPDKSIEDLNSQLLDIDYKICESTSKLDSLKSLLDSSNININNSRIDHSKLESKFSNLLSIKESLNTEKESLERSIQDYNDKKNKVIKLANGIIAEIKTLKDLKDSLSKIDFSKIESLTDSIACSKEKLTKNNVHIQNNILKIDELKIPLPLDASCKHCRQPLTQIHREECQYQIDTELQQCQNTIVSLKKENHLINDEIRTHQNTINSLLNSKKELEKTIDTISFKETEIKDKKSLHKEYCDTLDKLNKDLIDINNKIEINNNNLKESSKEEADKLKLLIDEELKKISTINDDLKVINKEISHLNANKAVIEHNIKQKQDDRIKKENLSSVLINLQANYSLYPSVLQAFSSTGIPNLIIQNVLDDLQVEANNLLTQLKPALQLSFVVEKTKTDGSEADTLEINYYLNGKDRQYDQLSGAQKLSVNFSLKLGLSFLLQKMIGTDIKFLLLDEIDQALDKASVDAFADIVKHFQKDFTILVITHNDRLKDKFKHSIVVEQDINMVSHAKVSNCY